MSSSHHASTSSRDAFLSPPSNSLISQFSGMAPSDIFDKIISRQVSEDCFNKFNHRRAKYGLHPYFWDENLYKIGNGYARNMFKKGRLFDFPNYLTVSFVYNKNKFVGCLTREHAVNHFLHKWVEFDNARKNLKDKDHGWKCSIVAIYGDGNNCYGVQMFTRHRNAKTRGIEIVAQFCQTCKYCHAGSQRCIVREPSRRHREALPILTTNELNEIPGKPLNDTDEGDICHLDNERAVPTSYISSRSARHSQGVKKTRKSASSGSSELRKINGRSFAVQKHVPNICLRSNVPLLVPRLAQLENPHKCNVEQPNESLASIKLITDPKAVQVPSLYQGLSSKKATSRSGPKIYCGAHNACNRGIPVEAERTGSHATCCIEEPSESVAYKNFRLLGGANITGSSATGRRNR